MRRSAPTAHTLVGLAFAIALPCTSGLVQLDVATLSTAALGDEAAGAVDARGVELQELEVLRGVAGPVLSEAEKVPSSRQSATTPRTTGRPSESVSVMRSSAKYP